MHRQYCRPGGLTIDYYPGGEDVPLRTSAHFAPASLGRPRRVGQCLTLCPAHAPAALHLSDEKSQEKGRTPLDKRQNLRYNNQAFGVWRSLVSRLVRDQEASGSSPDTPTILTKRYRCVWRKARRINRFRAFSGPDFFFQTIDANRCFRASAPIRTGRLSPFGQMHSASALFQRRFSRMAAAFFSKKNHKDLGVVLLVLTD